MDVNGTGKIEFAEFAAGIMGKNATRYFCMLAWSWTDQGNVLLSNMFIYVLYCVLSG